MKNTFMKASLTDSGNYIKDLIRKGENKHQDFKFEISDARKIARTFAAFANTEGGRLLIGVKDNGRISGIRSEEEAYMAESAAHLFCKPQVVFQLKKWIVDGHAVLEVNIPMSKKKPHYAMNEAGEWTAYLRVGDQNIQANRVLENVWKNEGKNKGIFLAYGSAEKALIKYLNENEEINLSKFMRIARINRLQGENILISLILLDVVEMDITERAVHYRLKEQIT
jgi:hypothetical protein